MSAADPPRPATVPAAAVWSHKDQEWILGPYDEYGAFDGVVEYWRADGTLCCRTPHRHGQPHGRAERFHESGERSQICDYVGGVMHGRRAWFASRAPTSEHMRTPDMGENVWRIEIEYLDGLFRSPHYYDVAGVEVDRAGAPVPPRPPGVPAETLYRSQSSDWMLATFRESGAIHGLARGWNRDGVLFVEERFEDGKRHGRSTFYDHRHGGARWYDVHYDHGVLDGEIVFYRDDGSIRRRGRFAAGEPVGPIEDWDAAGRPLPPIVVPPLVEQAPPAAPSAAEQALLDDLESQPAPGSLSPAAMAALLALGWGGDDERDARTARLARALALRLASPLLRERLATLGLQLAPRLMTEARVGRLVTALRDLPELDADRLLSDLIERGGPATALALGLGGSAALATMRRRVHHPRLDLTGLQLSEAPPLLAHFATVERLDLEHNQLTTVPRELAAMLRLRVLELGHNRIASLPIELERLDLDRLDLNDCQLERLPDNLLRLSRLETLNLGNNRLTTLPAQIAELRRLSWIWLHDNPLVSLPPELARCPVSFLHLGAAPWREPPGVLWEMQSLADLWLASPTLERLPPDIARLTNLRELCIWYSQLRELPAELYEMKQLREIRVSNNPLPAAAVAQLREALPDCKIY